MSNFNMTRFMDTFRWDIISNKKFFLKKFIGISLAFVLLMIMFFFMGNNTQMTAFYMLFIFVFIIVGASNIFINLKTKQEYTSYLMLPASNLEKYIVRWLGCTIIWSIIGILGFILADVVFVLLSYIFAWPDHTFQTGLMMNQLSGMFMGADFGSIVTGIITFVWLHSIYLLGGTFFRRNPTLLTTTVCFVVGIVSTIIITKIAMGIDWDVYEVNENVLDAYIFGGGIFFIILNYFLSYRMFKRFQIITSKWTNL